MRRKVAVVLSGLCAVLISAHIVFAGSTGKIAGRVYDKALNEGLPGANVILIAQIRDGKEVPLTRMLGAATDADGNFVILNVPPGLYKIRVQYLGYAPYTLTNVRVAVDLTTTIEFPLEEQVLQGDEVVVVAERAIVQKDLTSSESRVTGEQIADLPVQEVSDVLNLQAGVTSSPSGIHIRGGRSSEVAYFVDGVSITDSYDKSQAVIVENSSVEELQVISGTFNAEYGEAMSGIVNIVTKDGGEEYHGEFNWYSGDFVTSRNDIFIGLDKLRPLNTRNAQMSLNGPVPGFGSKFTFFSTMRFFKDNGHLYGKRVWDKDGNLLGERLPEGSDKVYDGEPVPLDWNRRYSGQVKLTYRFTPSVQLQLSALGSDVKGQNYDHSFAYAPDGRPFFFDRGFTGSLKLTHTLNANSFYTLNASTFEKSYKRYLYEDPLDPRYIHPDSLIEQPYNFRNSGTDLNHFYRSTRTNQLKLDYTNQVNMVHQMKAGLEFKRHRIYEEYINILPKNDSNGNEIRPFQPYIPSDTTINRGRYAFKPIEFSAYIQDKVELKSVIMNIGIRFDYFDSRGNVLADPSDPNVYQPLNDKYQSMPLEERLSVWYKKPSPKYQLSPRFGIAYPITDKGVIHFSYGYFLQRPQFRNLYQGTDYKVPKAAGSFGLYGNADLEAEKTVMYEIGLKQQIGESIGLDITGYYRDIRDWIGTGPAIETVGQGGQVLAGRTYRTFVNRDYANVRGITMSISQTRAKFFTYMIDYTYQVVEGSNSDPNEEFFALIGGGSPKVSITPLSWDQRHTLNTTFLINKNGWSATLIGRYSSGQPYTPSLRRAVRLGQNANLDLLINSRNKPDVFLVDLRLSKQIRVGKFSYIITLNAYNLLDRLNEFGVYSDSGRATTSSTFRIVESQALYNNTASEYLRQPFRFGAPREIQLGLRIGF